MAEKVVMLGNITTTYPGEKFKSEEISRSDRLIAIDEDSMEEMQSYSEGDVYINLDEDMINFGVYAGYEHLDEYLEIIEEDDDFEDIEDNYDLEDEEDIQTVYNSYILNEYYDWVCGNGHDHAFVAERVGLDLDACREDEVDYTIVLN